MQQHIRILAILNIVYGAMVALAGVIVLVVFGGLAGFAGMSRDSDTATGAGFFGILGIVIAGVIFVIAAPSIIAGFGLMKYAPWARILTIILSALHLLSVPFGTALGIYGLWVLLKPESEVLFSRVNAVSPPLR
jgi:Na+-translocating ferredoxin:NAD+ oxidoreductase RnfA subunit